MHRSARLAGGHLSIVSYQYYNSDDLNGEKKLCFFSISRTIIGLWKTKSSAIEQRAKMEEDHEEDASSVDLDDVHAVLSIGDVPLSKEYSLEHPVDVRSLCLLVPLFLTGFRIGYVILPAALASLSSIS